MTNEPITGQRSNEGTRSVLNLDILGASFTITTDANEEYLNEVLTKYRAAIKNTQNISGISEPLNVAVLTGFLLCDEFIKVEKQLIEAQAALSGEVGQPDKGIGETDAFVKPHVATDEQEAEERTLRLIAKLEQALRLYNDDKDI